MKELVIKGFTTRVQADDALAICAYGEQGSGKTRFCCTAPDPIGFVMLDRKSKKTIEIMVQDQGRTVVMPEQDFIRVTNPVRLAQMSAEDSIKYYRAHVDKVKEAVMRLYEHPQIRSIAIDTGTVLWEDILFANYGRDDKIMPIDRKAANREMKDLLDALSGKNLIITHKASDVWKNNKPTGKTKPNGYPHLGYSTNVMIEFVCDEEARDGTDQFYVNVPLCQANPGIQGPNGKKLLTGDGITFQALAMQIYPDSDPEVWS